MKEKIQTRTFSDNYCLWKKKIENSVSPLTYRRYTHTIEKHILPSFAQLPIQDISYQMILSFLRERAGDGMSDSSLKMIVLLLNKLFSYGGIRLPKIESEDYLMPDREQKKSILSAGKMEIIGEEDCKSLEEFFMKQEAFTYIGVLLSLKMGLMLGEVCGLRWEDVDFQNGILHINNAVQRIANSDNHAENKDNKTVLVLSSLKGTSEEREIPIPVIVYQQLEAYRTENMGYILRAKKGKMPDPRTEQFRLARLAKELEIKDCNYNILRNTFAAHCIQSGMRIENLSRILGHKNVMITASRYSGQLNTEDFENIKQYMR